jgi:hypothetical protein
MISANDPMHAISTSRPDSIMSRRKAIVGLSFFSGPSFAAACPFCETETGAQVRAGILHDQFGENLMLILLPLLVLVGLVVLICADRPWFIKKPIETDNLLPSQPTRRSGE